MGEESTELNARLALEAEAGVLIQATRHISLSLGLGLMASEWIESFGGELTAFHPTFNVMVAGRFPR